MSVRSFTVAAIAVAIVSLAPVAQARPYRHHHARALTVSYLPAHQRSDWVGVAGVPVPGIADLGLGPVFPFSGWPNRF